MMTWIREKTHWLLYALIVFFIALIVIEWGANYTDIANKSRGTIGKINGEDIRYADFATVYNNQMNNARAQKDGEALTDAEMEQLSDQIWNQIVEEKLLREYMKENHVAVGDTEVVFELRNNPPEFIKNTPAFLTDGNFDMNKYQQALNNPQYAKEWAQVEQMLRMQMPYNKLQAMIATSPRISESELRQEYARRNIKLNGQIVFFSPADIPASSVQVTDAEAQSYYDNHKDDYKQEEKARLAFVSFSTEATKEDSAEVIERVNEVKKQVLEGKDFAELAKLNSVDRAANQQGGSLGWFTKGAMVREFEEACFNAKKGDVIGPVITSFGYHIIKIDSTRFVKDKKTRAKKAGEAEDRDSVLARHILIRMEASQTTIETARENANAFYETAKDNGFDKALEKYASRFNLTPDTTLDIVNNENGIVAGFAERMKNVTRFAFTEKVGAVHRPHQTGRGVTIFAIVSRTDKGIQPFEAVKERVRNTVMEEKRMTMAYQKAQELRSKINSLADLKALDSTLTVRDLTNFTMNNSIIGVGRDAKINGVLFSTAVGALSEAIKGNRGAYIAFVATRDDINESQFRDARNDLRRQLQSTKQQRAYRDWVESMKKQASIKDFRPEFNL
ncbi:SurA N-terminal domain-containing protein [bacterium]|nr:SurA N-terminal domain-containing protein [bacterium]NUN46292.1 SurA N-terminal domain-containing protein [bacterium]